MTTYLNLASILQLLKVPTFIHRYLFSVTVSHKNQQNLVTNKMRDFKERRMLFV